MRPRFHLELRAATMKVDHEPYRQVLKILARCTFASSGIHASYFPSNVTTEAPIPNALQDRMQAFE